MGSMRYIRKTQREGGDSGNRRSLLHWLLASLFVAQALVPVQSHTVLRSDGHGHVKQVCTLHLDAARADLPDIQPGADESAKRSAAVDFSLLLAEALDTHAAVAFGLAESRSRPLLATMPPAAGSRPEGHSLIRAPPGLI